MGRDVSQKKWKAGSGKEGESEEGESESGKKVSRKRKKIGKRR